MRHSYFPLICIALLLTLAVGGCRSGKGELKGQTANHLAGESSVYLLQHVHNPVDWYPWGEEALGKAKQEQKLLVISIGYASCYWCHVMEREAFSDTAVSRLMNAHFVSIKVDREERPDVDNVYMTACQISNRGGSCGWPLNAVALPDGRPVWVGTYLTRDEWMQLLQQINDLYHEDQNELQKIANQIANHLQTDHRFRLTDDAPGFDPAGLSKLHNQLLAELDHERGGRRGDIKFPMPSLLQYAQEYAHFSGEARTKAWVEQTLQQLMRGGIYDHLAGGFARYSTDPDWQVPHFEKMLYDNAQLVSVYARAYQWTGKIQYKELVEDCLAFMRSECSSGDGRYFASFDAESEGEEGKYYAWTAAEVRNALGDERLFALASQRYGIAEAGNWEKGKNVLRLVNDPEALASENGLAVAQVQSQLDTVRKRLLETRCKRVAPRRDEKVITAWNAMMALGYADAYAALGEPRYREEALRIGRFLRDTRMGAEAKMSRTEVGNRGVQAAFLDDYAFTALAFLRLYEITFDEAWLAAAQSICDRVIETFSDEDGVYFYYTASDEAKLIARKKEMTDQVIASSNSAMCDALHRLGLYYYRDDYLRRSQHMVAGVVSTLANQGPAFYSNWLRKYLHFLRPPYEVAIVGTGYEQPHQQLLASYLPNAILLGGATEGSLELLKEKLQEGSTYIYVCRNKVCKLPVTQASEALKLIK